MKSADSHLPPILKRPIACNSMDHFSTKQRGLNYAWGRSSDKPQRSSGRRVRFSGATDLPSKSAVCHKEMSQPSHVAESRSQFMTTFRESYQGLPGAPGVSKCPKPFLPPPYKVGQTSYAADFYAKPTVLRRTPPRTKNGNRLAMYPSNVLYPYQQPAQVITVWKPFPTSAGKFDDTERTQKVLDRLSRENYITSYQLSFMYRPTNSQ